MLTLQQRALVRDSWALVGPIAPEATTLFYERLFALDPTLRSLFAHADMAAQRAKLAHMLGVAVASLDQLDALAPAMEALGRRHAGYGVRDAHYATVGDALLWTLERGLGAAFTPAVRDAWAATFALLAGIMRSASASTTGPVAIAPPAVRQAHPAAAARAR